MADYLTDEEQVDRLKNWWSENGTSVIVSIVLVVGGVAGWRWYDVERAEEIQAASEAYDSFLAAQGDARAALAASLETGHGASSYATFARLHQAKEAVEAGDLDSAIAVLKQIAANDHPLLQDVARVRLARLMTEQGDADAALGVLAEVTSQGFRALVLELKGDIHLQQGARAPAHEAYLAARAELQEGEQRPILDIKVDDTAPSAAVQ